MNESIKRFRRDCAEQAEIKIKNYFNSIIEPGIHEKFETIRVRQTGRDKLINSVNSFSKELINDIFNFIKSHVFLLEKQLKSNYDSVVKVNQAILAQSHSQLVLDDQGPKLIGENKEEAKIQKEQSKFKERLQSNRPNMLMKKVFLKPTRYIWKYDRKVDKQEEKFFKEF